MDTEVGTRPRWLYGWGLRVHYLLKPILMNISLITNHKIVNRYNKRAIPIFTLKSPLGRNLSFKKINTSYSLGDFLRYLLNTGLAYESRQNKFVRSTVTVVPNGWWWVPTYSELISNQDTRYNKQKLCRVSWFEIRCISYVRTIIILYGFNKAWNAVSIKWSGGSLQRAGSGPS